MHPHDKIMMLINELKKKLKLSNEQGIHLYSNQKIAKMDDCFERLYPERKQNDGFLYFEISTLPSFGFSIRQQSNEST